MDFTIRNKYIKKFLSNYANRNPIKLMKYLSIIGIDALNKNHRGLLSYEDLQQMAKRISRRELREKRAFDNEIASIKNEIASLNAKFDEKLNKLKDYSSKDKGSTKEIASEAKSRTTNERENKFTSKPKGDRDAGISASRPTVEAKEKDYPLPRSSSVEASIYPSWWGYLEPKEVETAKKITPKITETQAPHVPRSREKVISRHHLDDEIGRSFFNDKTEEVVEGDYHQLEHNTLQMNNSQSPKFNAPDEVGQKTGGFRNVNGDSHSNIPNLSDYISTKPQLHQNYFISAGKPKEVSNKLLSKDRTNNKPQNSSSRPQPRERTLFLSHASVPPSKKPKSVQNPQYSHIKSKIKDKVHLDKQLSKQYKKVKGVLNDQPGDKGDSFQYSEFGSRKHRTHLNNSGYPTRDQSKNQNQSKFIFFDKGDNRSIYTRPATEKESPDQNKKASNILQDESNLIHAQSDEVQPHSTESTSPVRNQRGFSTEYQWSRTPPQDSFNKGEQYSAHKSDEYSQFRDPRLAPQSKGYPHTKFEAEKQYNQAINARRNETNIQDIANNFINSPLMHHLSSQDQRNSDNSFKGSGSFPSALKSNANVADFEESKSPSTFTRSPNSRPFSEEEQKNSQEKGQRHSDWVGVYNFNKSRDQPSFLKESRNKKLSDYKREDSDASFSSSTFSNFNLNEDMKGFYQNMFWEQNKKNETSNFRRGGSQNLEDENLLNDSYDDVDDGRYRNDRNGGYIPRKGNAYNSSYVTEYGNVNRSNRYANVSGSGHSAGRSSAGRYSKYP